MKIRKWLSVLLILCLTANVLPVAANAYSLGDTIEFGTYPQTGGTDEALIASLDAAPKTWASCRCYSGNNSGCNGRMQPGDWMRFADFFYDGV